MTGGGRQSFSLDVESLKQLHFKHICFSSILKNTFHVAFSGYPTI